MASKRNLSEVLTLNNKTSNRNKMHQGGGGSGYMQRQVKKKVIENGIKVQLTSNHKQSTSSSSNIANLPPTDTNRPHQNLLENEKIPLE